jgi:hypothetical protein
MIRISIIPQMRLVQYEYILVGVPDFYVPDSSPVLQTVDGNRYDAFTAIFKNATEGRPYANILLQLRRGYTVEPGQTVALVIPQSAGVRLPLYGNIRNNPKLILGTNASNGAVWEQPVDNSAPVGSFGTSPAVHMGESRTTVFISFTPSMALVNGDSVNINIPLFTTVVPGATNVTLSGTSRAIFGAVAQITQDADSVTINLRVAAGKSVAAYDIVSVVVQDLRVNQAQMRAESQLTISADAVNGRVPATTIEKVCKIERAFSRCCSKFQCLF